MNESYRMGEQSIIAHLQRLANGASTAELDVDALPTELRAVGEQLQKTLAVLQQERQLLERSAYIDSLTNLGNRGGLDRHVNQLWLKGTPFTCAYIDIDHLKHCNDKFGHAEGNRYILGICRALTETMEHDEMLFRIGGDEFVLVSPTTGEAELEQRLERTRTDLVEATSDGKAPMIASFSFGCSHVDPLAGDSRRQMTMDADRKMYRYKLMHRVQQPKDNDVPQHPIVDQLPCNDRVFQAISMSSETRYPFILNLDTGESQWSVNAVRDFDLPSQHPFNSVDMWLARVHPEDRDNVRAELDMVINGTWHFHYMQYRVMDATGAYALCGCTGYRLDGTDTEPNMYVGIIINRSLADTTDSVTGLGDVHALVSAIGEMRRVAREAGLMPLRLTISPRSTPALALMRATACSPKAQPASWIVRAARAACSAQRGQRSWHSSMSSAPRQSTRSQATSNGSWVLPCSSARLNISRPFAWPRSIWTLSIDSPFPF